MESAPKQPPNAQWQERYDAALRSAEDVAKKAGWPFKRATTVCEDREIVIWNGDSETTGTIRIDPTRHDPEAAAHEFGHGIHERLRTDSRFIARIVDANGEDFAEMMRRRVEKLLGRTPSVGDNTDFFKKFGDNWEVFVGWVNGKD